MLAGCLELVDTLKHGFEIQLAQVLAFDKVIDEVADVGGVARKVERQQVGIGQAQRGHSPQLRHQSVIAVAGIAEVVHAEKVVIGGVVDAIRSVELQAEDRHAHKVKEHGVVGATPDAGIGKIRVCDFFRLFGLAALPRG